MTNRTSKLEHWTNPRKTIATRYETNDIGYATHGAIQASVFLKQLNMRPSDCADRTLLDFGCGTGRIGRVLAPLFKEVYQYDPVYECIQEGHKEMEQIDMPFYNVKITHNWNEIPECDIALSVNVIEHLTHLDQVEMIQRLRERVKGPTVLWYSVPRNKSNIAPYLSPDQILTDQGGQIMVRAIHFRSPR